MPTPSEAEDAEPDALAEKALALVLGLHVIVICLHVLHVNVVTYVIFFYIQANLHVNSLLCKWPMQQFWIFPKLLHFVLVVEGDTYLRGT